MYHYRAYDLTIRSCLLLPELQEIAPVDQPDIEIQFGTVDWELPTPAPEWKHFDRHKDNFYCYWKVVGKFLVRQGKEIIIEAIPEALEGTIRLPLLGAVLAIALHQRRYFSLHASAVVINHQAALFLGASGQGKSTTAATLFGRGHQLITDDVAAIDFTSKTPMLLPAFPRVKLWPEAVTSALKQDPNALIPIHPEVTKVGVSATSRFCEHSVPIARIYILTTKAGTPPRITSLQHQDVVSRLTENAYVPMVLGAEFAHLMPQTERFEQVCKYVKVAKVTTVCQLERPRDLNLLPDLAALVENDLMAESLATEAS